MSGIEREFLLAIELHDVQRLRAALDAGLDLQRPLRGRLPLDWLTSMYTRSPRFAACATLLLERGAECSDAVLAAVLRDDTAALALLMREAPERVDARIALDCAFTPLRGATLLHLATEFQHARCVRVLLDAGAQVDARARTAAGADGHTALFHAVNAHADGAAEVRALLLGAGARVDVRVDFLVWGEGMEWETPCFDLTPISYAQLGLLPQMQREEATVYQVLAELLHAAGRDVPRWHNLPNRYLRSTP